MEQVTEAQRTVDVDKSKALLAKVFKNAGQQHIQENDQGGRTANMLNFHKGQGGKQGAAKLTSVIWTSSGRHTCWKAGIRISQPIRAGREDHSVSAGKAENA